MSDKRPTESEPFKQLRWIASQPEIEDTADGIRAVVDGTHTASALAALIRVTAELLSLASADGKEELLVALVPAIRARMAVAARDGLLKRRP